MDMEEIVSVIKESNLIGITFHQSPDGDSLGSSTALLQGLESMGKKAYIMSKEEVSDTFSYLYGSDSIGTVSDVMEGTDLVVVVDCGDVKRINANIDFQNRDYKIVNIDHHMSNEGYGDVNYVSVKSAAVGEIVHDILTLAGVKITKSIGESIYTSLLTDTSSFKHSNTTRKTHEVAGAVIESGVNFNEIQRRIFEDKDFNKVKFYGELINTISLKYNGKIAFMQINEKSLSKCDLENIDSSEVIHFGTMIKGVEVVALFKEAKDGVKVSLRSRAVVDVSKVAEMFGGGGHMRAAGFFCDGSLEEVEISVLKILENELKNNEK